MTLSQAQISAATQAIRDHQRLLVIPHANVDPDGLSSALACYELFTALGKDVTVICPDTLPESLKFLPGFSKLEQDIAEHQNFVITVNLDEGVEVDKLRYTVEDKKVNIIVVPKYGRVQPRNISFGEGEKRYDLIVVVDTADLSLLGRLYSDHTDCFASHPVLNIDHHISNTQFGQLQMIDPTAASATEVLYDWFRANPDWNEKVTPDIATLLLTGLITDTRSFQNPNTTPRSLEVAAELLERGARQQEIIQNIYKTKPLSTLKIWGRALNRIQVDPVSGIVWSSVSKEDLQEMEASSKETHGILDELISTIPNADVHVLFTEVEEWGLKASMRSSPAIDVSRLAAETYGGGGHARASGFRVRSFSNFQLQVIECVQKLKEGMARQRTEADLPLPESGKLKVKSARLPDGQGKPSKPEPKKEEVQRPQEPKAEPPKERDIVEDLTGQNPKS
ncbi:bifunctional oligoribonuclease/PAP phosphatase NrnA [Candidatus Peregrinibacteria bacterium]|nr:bifunctional oligoribonuclease/PAP phosphatase NrnA [Candidatus Peregrinibacteria bacterium]